MKVIPQIVPDTPRYSQILPDTPRFSQILPDTPRNLPECRRNKFARDSGGFRLPPPGCEPLAAQNVPKRASAWKKVPRDRHRALENAVNAAISARMASECKKSNLVHICRLGASLGGTSLCGSLRPPPGEAAPVQSGGLWENLGVSGSIWEYLGAPTSIGRAGLPAASVHRG